MGVRGREESLHGVEDVPVELMFDPNSSVELLSVKLEAANAVMTHDRGFQTLTSRGYAGMREYAVRLRGQGRGGMEFS
jgi:hypothetical protein